MDVNLYLDRIGHTGTLKVGIDTLRVLHRAHLMSIAYENLDIHLGKPLVLSGQAFFDKLVEQQRGGWCYEMNGLFAWALHELGFPVRLLSGTVGRDRYGDAAEGNHLVLLVDLDKPYIADVGFGDGFLEPLPLEPGQYTQDYLTFGLSHDNEHPGRWIVQNHPHGGAPGFDFTLEPRRLEDFAAKCQEQQTSPSSGFVRVTVCQKYLKDSHITLRGAILKTVDKNGAHEQIIDNRDDYVRTLRSRFGLDVDISPELWEKIWAGHQEFMKARAAS